MYTKIALRLTGIDLRDSDNYLRVPEELHDLDFEANGGISIASYYTADPRPVGAVVDYARCIAKHMPGVTVREVYDELVSTSDIAARCGLGAEAVRLWTTGRRRSALHPFPQPRQVVSTGRKTMNLYAWREVLTWVREVVGIDPDENVTYLDDRQIAEVNAELAGLAATAISDSNWHEMDSSSIDLSWTPPGGPVEFLYQSNVVQIGVVVTEPSLHERPRNLNDAAVVAG